VKPLLALARADIVMYLSNRRALLVTLAAPIFIAAFFGSVLGGPPKKAARVPIAVVDLDSSPISKSIVGSMKADSTFEIQDVAEPDAISLVRAGKARAAVVIPPDFGKTASRSMFQPGAVRPEIAVHYDPSQTITLSLVKGLLAEHVMKAVSAGTSNGGAAQGFSLPFATRELEVTSSAAHKYNSFAHAFAGMGVQFILFMGIELGMAVLLMRRQGIWKRLRAAPLSRALLLGSRIVSGTVIATLLFIGIYAAAFTFFGVRVEGSFAGFVGVAIAFALLTATFGLLIAAVGRTPEATRGVAIVATLLLVMLGGAWVPTFVFPEWLQTATLVVPTRWAIDGLDAMTWRGLGIEAALAPIGAMLALSAAFGWIAVKRFKWDE